MSRTARKRDTGAAAGTELYHRQNGVDRSFLPEEVFTLNSIMTARCVMRKGEKNRSKPPNSRNNKSHGLDWASPWEKQPRKGTEGGVPALRGRAASGHQEHPPAGRRERKPLALFISAHTSVALMSELPQGRALGISMNHAVFRWRTDEGDEVIDQHHHRSESLVGHLPILGLNLPGS